MDGGNELPMAMDGEYGYVQNLVAFFFEEVNSTVLKMGLQFCDTC